MTTWPPTVAAVPANDGGGRDLVFGEVHGCFATVEAALEDLRYDPKRDRLFSLGDTIDYGPRSADALEWTQSRFTCTVRGNHEDMMCDWTVLGERLSNQGATGSGNGAGGGSGTTPARTNEPGGDRPSKRCRMPRRCTCQTAGGWDSSTATRCFATSARPTGTSSASRSAAKTATRATSQCGDDRRRRGRPRRTPRCRAG